MNDVEKTEPESTETNKFEKFIFNIDVATLLLGFIALIVFFFIYKNRFILSFAVLMGLIYCAAQFYESEKQGYTRHYFRFYLPRLYVDIKKNSSGYFVSQAFGLIIIFALFALLFFLLTNENAVEVLKEAVT